MPNEADKTKASFKALIPFFIFIVFYVGLSIVAKDFYRVPMVIAFLVAVGCALFLSPSKSFDIKMEVFAKGMGEINIMLMCLIFILAGTFASITKGMGAVDSAVLIARHFIPARFMLAGFFLMSCFLSMSIGTSCGTVACLVPIAMGMVEPLRISPELMLGTVIGGSMFGDNLSLISDTTIAATRTQNVKMKDKFLTNFKFILPAALLCILIYLFQGKDIIPLAVNEQYLPCITISDVCHVIPYIVIIVLAIAGYNVMGVLFLAMILVCIIGYFTQGLKLWQGLDLAGKGALGMSETLIVALLAGGLLHIIRWNGGIRYITQTIKKIIHDERGCSLGIFLLTSLINIFTANNTVAIVIAGPLAKELSDQYGCCPKRIASILDTSSCFIQGIIPYGAQVLSAVALAKGAGYSISSLSVMGTLYYPYLLGISTLIFIFLSPCKR